MTRFRKMYALLDTKTGCQSKSLKIEDIVCGMWQIIVIFTMCMTKETFLDEMEG